MVSGGFDPVHIGHIRMIQDAARWGTVIVAINSDDWLMRKKGYVFMPWKQRAEIIGNKKESQSSLTLMIQTEPFVMQYKDTSPMRSQMAEIGKKKTHQK